MKKFMTAMIALGLTACTGGSKHNTDPNDTSAHRLAGQFSISCEDPQHCPDGTAAIVIATPTIEALCTSFIAGELDGLTVVGTNKHCVEEITNCHDQMAFVYPQSGNQGQETGICRRILTVSPYDLSNSDGSLNVVPDYAFIQLDRKINRPILPISQNGIAYGAAITIQVAEHLDSESQTITLRTKTCTTTSEATVIADDYSNQSGANIGLENCGIVPGESGSAIRNSAGEVVGIAQIGVKPGAQTELSAQAMGVGTNLSCANFPDLNLSPQPGADCSSNATPEGRAATMDDYILRQQVSNLRATLNGYLDFLLHHQDGYFAYHLAEAKDADFSHYMELAWLSKDDRPESLIQIVPQCLLRAEEPSSKLGQLRKENSSLLKSYGTQRVGDSFSAWGAFFKIQPDAEVTVTSKSYQRNSMLEFDLDSLDRLLDADTLAVTEAGQDSSWYAPYNLRFCDRGQDDAISRDIALLQKLVRDGSDDDVVNYVKSRK